MHFLITAGGTREYIDTVRFITNASSGKMGYALARAAKAAGHKVTLITAASDQPKPKGLSLVRAETTAQMLSAVKKHFKNSDCLIMAAAVSDYSVANRSKTKIKKTGKELTIKLTPTTDILKWAGSCKKKGQVVVGFALEDKAVRANAERKLASKNLDMIIANTPAAIGADSSCVQVKHCDGKWLELPRATKNNIAKKIIKLIEDTAKQ
ncbi:phosphopantothenoylcysteine decarboxylase [Planctomycetota bacterium]